MSKCNQSPAAAILSQIACPHIWKAITRPIKENVWKMLNPLPTLIFPIMVTKFWLRLAESAPLDHSERGNHKKKVSGGEMIKKISLFQENGYFECSILLVESIQKCCKFCKVLQLISGKQFSEHWGKIEVSCASNHHLVKPWPSRTWPCCIENASRVWSQNAFTLFC